MHSSKGVTSSAPSSTPNTTAETVTSSAENDVRPKGKDAAKASTTVSLYSRAQPTVSFVSDVYLCTYSDEVGNIHQDAESAGE